MGSSTPALALLVTLLCACAPHEREASDLAEPAAESLPPSPRMTTFSDELVALDSRDPQVLMRAIEVWMRHHVLADAETRLAGLVRLRQTFADVEKMWAAQIEIAPLEPELIEALERGGFHFYDRAGDPVHLDPDLVERHANAILRPQDRRWLQAVAWDDGRRTRMQGDTPYDLVRSMMNWELVIDVGDPWASRGRQELLGVLTLYLEMCLDVADDGLCPIPAYARYSYGQFVDEQTDSRLHGAVAYFFETTKAHRFDVTVDDVAVLVAEAKQRVATKRPSQR